MCNKILYTLQLIFFYLYHYYYHKKEIFFDNHNINKLIFNILYSVIIYRVRNINIKSKYFIINTYNIKFL